MTDVKEEEVVNRITKMVAEILFSGDRSSISGMKVMENMTTKCLQLARTERKKTKKLKIITKQGQYHRNRSFAWCWCLVYMIFQITGLPAWVFAFLASKGFLTSVGKHVIFQSAWPPAREAALIAGKGILSRMLQYVFLDIISLDAWIVALVTTEMPLPWMCWHVLFEVAPLCEGRGTMGAFKGLLPWISEGWVWFNPCSTVDHWYSSVKRLKRRLEKRRRLGAF